MSEKSETLNLTQVEEMFTVQAVKLARQLGYRTDNFRIELVQSVHGKGSSELFTGATVRICLVWPSSIKNVVRQIESWLHFINTRKNIWTPLMLGNIAYAQGVHRKFRRLVSQDPADEFPELLPQHRIRVITTHTITYEDMITKESVSHAETRTERLNTTKISSLWTRLSNNVHAKHPLEELEA